MFNLKVLVQLLNTPPYQKQGTKNKCFITEINLEASKEVQEVGFDPKWPAEAWS